MDFILASKSKTRCDILQSVMPSFHSVSPNIDEKNIIRSLLMEDTPHYDIPIVLAEFKAKKVSTKHPGSWVLGCDQILSFDGEVFGKPASNDALCDNLVLMAGKTHKLITANVIYKDTKPMWRYTAVSHLKMYSMTKSEIKNYSDTFWHQVQHSSGGYCFENTPHLFSTVKGNWFDIMGISITQVLQFLKQHDRSIVGKTPKIAAVLGSPISHSKSPIMHCHWLKKNKIAGDYIAIDVSKEKFSQTVKVLADVGVSGFNVTLPHKKAALTLADSHTEQAKKIGAANTLFVDVNGAIKADNTDGYGFMANLKANNANWLPSAGSAMVLGAGGAARAILVSLLEAGVPKIYLSNRTMATSQKLADHFSSKIEVIDWEKKDTCLSNISLLVNTTSLGMAGKPPLNINLSSLAKKALVTDLVYAPIKTPLLIQAEEMGCDIVTGVGMLIHQGVPGFNGWFGILPKVDNEITELVTR